MNKKRQMFVTIGTAQTIIVEFDEKFDFHGFIKDLGGNGLEIHVIPKEISYAGDCIEKKPKTKAKKTVKKVPTKKKKTAKDEIRSCANCEHEELLHHKYPCKLCFNRDGYELWKKKKVKK